MDENVKLIELIKERPILYKTLRPVRKDLHSQKPVWKEVAALSGYPESWVKKRWYSLREQFIIELSNTATRGRKRFKYFDEMSFLLKAASKDKTVPVEAEDLEFVITAEELEEESDEEDSYAMFVEMNTHDTSQENDVSEEEEEMVYETLDDTYTPSQANVESQSDNSNQSETYAHGKDLEDEPDNSQDQEDFAQLKKMSEARARDFKELINELKESCTSDSSSKDMQRVNSQTNEDGPSEEEVNQKLVPENNTESEETLMPNAGEKDSADSNANCPDAIFGKLVTATLKQMDEKKKNDVKRAIMNILYS